MTDIILKVKGKEYGGWTSATVEKSLYTMTGAFGFSATDIFPGNFRKWGFSMGDECQVIINGQVVITGYIEDIPISYDATSHNIQIGGRDKTGDLVDCSFIKEPAKTASTSFFGATANEWKGQTIETVIKALCKPYQITVNVDASVSAQASYKIANETFKANEGDTVFDMVSKLCKMKGILPVSYGDGKLTLTGTGTQKANDILELGKNVKEGSFDQSDKDRFRTYVVKGQGKGKDEKALGDTGQPIGEYLDALVKRHRPMVLFTETSCDAGYCKDRAKWESLSKAGNSRKLEYTVQGLTQSNGKIWPLNSLVKVKDDFLGIKSKDALLISAVKYSISNGEGSITRLTVVHPDAFKLATTPIPISSEVDNLGDIFG